MYLYHDFVCARNHITTLCFFFVVNILLCDFDSSLLIVHFVLLSTVEEFYEKREAIYTFNHMKVSFTYRFIYMG